MEQYKCIGCGVELQNEDPKKLGFVPSFENVDNLVCKRCFRLKNYNELQEAGLTEDDFLKILNNIGTKKALIVKIVDIFDFNGSWISGIHRFVGNNEVILVGNKVDLIPKSVKANKIINWMRGAARDQGLKPMDVHLISAVKGTGVVELLESIEASRKGKDVYVVGCTNVGKSTLINKIIKIASESDDNVITTSHFPGTTLDVIEIPFDEESSLYDTPGLINKHQLAHYVSSKTLKYITPKKEVKQQVYQLNSGQTLYIAGLARFDFVSGERNSFVCYFPNDLNIHRTKLDNADELYIKHAGTLLSPPSPDELIDIPKFVSRDFTINEDKTDIVFSGLGWITIPNSGVKITAHAPKGVGIFTRKSLI
ncbi:MAG: GTP-binding protein YqeH, required for biosis of ribosome subunit [Bacillales bacterium]|jgi:ribosome biogenesis GTPase YqeH|nr:GTP-binding protein YqeH, required for biosis of ribosome subunit [Bacillales bacterium]